MNINEYKEQEAKKVPNVNLNGLSNTGQEIAAIKSIGMELGFKIGFDCAMNLGLAVKFIDWKEENNIQMLGYPHYYYSGAGIDYLYLKTNQELFDYWVENILKIE